MKTCSQCKIEQPLTSFYRRGDRLRTDCKTCVKIRVATYKMAHLEECRLRDRMAWEAGRSEREAVATRKLEAKTNSVSKFCTQCQHNKPTTEFYKTPTGLRHNCKPCHDLLAKNSAEKHLERVKRNRSISHAVERAKKQLLKGSDQDKLEALLFLTSRSELRGARHEKSKMKQLAHSSNRRAFFRTAGKLTAEQIQNRFKVFDNQCAYCGGPAETVDHVIAIARGGLNLPANIRPACNRCNSSKGAKKLSEWKPKKLVREVVNAALTAVAV